VSGKEGLKAAVVKLDVSKAKLKADVVVKLNEVNNSQEDGAQGVLNDVFAHLAGSCDGHWVRVDHAEALLVD